VRKNIPANLFLWLAQLRAEDLIPEGYELHHTIDYCLTHAADIVVGHGFHKPGVGGLDLVLLI
jgi:hypothetical protein